MPRRRPLAHDFPAEVLELPAARARLRGWLEGTVEDTATRQDLLLVGTELCTEAVQRQGAGRVSLRAWSDDHTVVLEVRGPAGGPPGPPLPTFKVSPSDGRWRARILAEVCDDVSTRREAQTRTVRCIKRTQRAAGGD